jgi:glycosyltransferase involved in cell wall biosynthesis
MKKNLFYFGLEPINARYTYQLCQQWMPDTFKRYEDTVNFIPIEVDYVPDQQIKVGAVLDAVGRGKYSLAQCSKFLDLLQGGLVRNGDIIFLQDFWTSGIDSLFYALDLYGIKDIKLYAMLHAQSVDEYDFTYYMRDWMRYYELGLDKRLSGIFVGSTIHKEQLRAAGFNAPIHVVSLPIHKQLTESILPNHTELEKKNVVVFSSRFDKEKNPFFMMSVAERFLLENPDWEWHITTSGREIRSMLPGVIEMLYELSDRQPRFKILTNLTKTEYYTELATCKIQFNSSLQDYVSWTVIESTIFGADIVFPNFRSFPEFIDSDRLYKPFDIDSAIERLCYVMHNLKPHHNIGELSDLGRLIEGYIICNGIDVELNVWHEAEYCKHLIKL